MSDAAQPWTDAAGATPKREQSDARPAGALDGDWSEGLVGAARDHGLPMPARIDGPAQLPPPAAVAAPSRAAEELAAEAASGIPPESLRTEQASAKAIFAAEEQRHSAATAIAPIPTHAEEAPPAVVVEPTVHVAPEPPARTAAQSRLDEEVASNIQRALALEGRAEPSQPAPPDLWSVSSSAPSLNGSSDAPTPWSEPWADRTAAAGPEVWAAAPPKDLGEAPLAGPDWGATPAESSESAGWPTPSTDPTLMSATPLQAQSGEEDLPVPVPEAERRPVTIGRPAFLSIEPRVVVHTLAGRVKRGTLREPDLERPELRLSPQTGGAEERISLTEVKAVFFMLEPGEVPPEKPGGRVRITLSDGRQLDGFRESDGPKGGVFLVPLDAARTNTRAIFVCGDAIQAVDQA